MRTESKIYISGGKGMIASALSRLLHARGYKNIIERTTSELDLRNQNSVDQFFKIERPEYVFIPAEKPEPVYTNQTLKAEIFYDSLMMESNLIHAAWKYGVTKLLFLGNSCIYP